jgi:cholesterol transport system auxiliary component
MRPSLPAKFTVHLAALCVLSLVLAGCSLPIRAPEPQDTFRLNSTNLHTPAIINNGQNESYLVQIRSLPASHGFQTPEMMYSLDAQNLTPYRDSRWLAAPANMLNDAIEQTLLRQPWVAGIVANSASAPVAINLSCRLIRLEHDLNGNKGKAHLVMTCLWINPADRTVQSHWRFDETQSMPQNNATQFAAASQQLVDQAIGQIVNQTRAVIIKQTNTNT